MLTVGVDEAGRGPIFGPVVTAAVVLNWPKINMVGLPDIIRDSKTLSERQIKLAYQWVLEHSLCVGVAANHADIIDKTNILEATMQAMHLAIDCVVAANPAGESNLEIKVDGNIFRPARRLAKHECLVGGDKLCPEISAASIVAKYTRDCWIWDLCAQYPKLDQQYGLAKNKGYGEHMISQTKALGTTPWHRLSYKPCQHLSINQTYLDLPNN